MASLLCGAGFLRRLASRLHKKCNTPTSSAPASASVSSVGSASASSLGSATSLGSGSGVFSPVSVASGHRLAGVPSAVSSPLVGASGSPSSGTAVAPVDILRNAAVAARATGVIRRKALPEIPTCTDDEYELANLLGMKAPPPSYWTVPYDNPDRVSALSRDGNPPAACSSLPSIEEGEEPLPEPSPSGNDDDDDLSACLSSGSSLRREHWGSDHVLSGDPLFTSLCSKVLADVGDLSDDDDDNEVSSCTSGDTISAHEKCAAFVAATCAAEFAHDLRDEPALSSLSVRPLVEDELSEPVGVEQALDSSSLRPAPLTIRKKVVEPVAHPEPKRVLVTYSRGATHCRLHPALEALCLHLNA